MALAKNSKDICAICGSNLDLSLETVGSAVYMKWICKDQKHIVHKWCSQPILNRRLHGGDLMIAAALLFSGNNFSKLALFASFLNLSFVSAPVYNRIQRVYLVPTIDTYWNEQQTAPLNTLRERQVVLLGDSRNDSPGHSAQYCTYTVLDNDTKKILAIVTLDKRLTDRKSTNLEKAAFLKVLAFLQQREIDVVEVVTDAHPQIPAIMKRDYPNIKHSFDIWHVGKNLGKKLIKASQDKECRALLPWTQHIVNHFWHAAQTASDYNEFIGIWFGVVHHVVGVHEWQIGYGSGPNHCSHGPLAEEERELQWLQKGDAAHVAMRKIIMDKRLLNNVPYYVNFRSTAELENFQNHILMYASKRFAYAPPVYRARNLLAGLDYNAHLNRGVAVNKNETQRYQRLFNKKSGRWTAVEVKKKKEYKYIPELMNALVTRRLQDKVGMHRRALLEEDDPRRLSKNLSPIPPPPTHELVSAKKSRMKSND